MWNATQLPLERCPQCSISKPLLMQHWQVVSMTHDKRNPRLWATYRCESCGSMVMTVAPVKGNVATEITQIWPTPQTVAEAVPTRAREFLSQAMASLHAPAGAVMLTASAVDAMLKERGLKEGSLYSRIDTAAKAHLITAEMAAWAHEIRLEANDQRHADEGADMPNSADAEKVIEFAKALAQFLYVLPARVERGRKS
jgi:hypothetical protein